MKSDGEKVDSLSLETSNNQLIRTFVRDERLKLYLFYITPKLTL